MKIKLKYSVISFLYEMIFLKKSIKNFRYYVDILMIVDKSFKKSDIDNHCK